MGATRVSASPNADARRKARLSLAVDGRLGSRGHDVRCTPNGTVVRTPSPVESPCTNPLHAPASMRASAVSCLHSSKVTFWLQIGMSSRPSYAIDCR